MSIRHSCDGCGSMLPDGAKPAQVGTVLKRDYCPDCGALAERYLKEVSEAHTEAAKAWDKTLNVIRLRYLSIDGNGLHALPDTNCRGE